MKINQQQGRRDKEGNEAQFGESQLNGAELDAKAFQKLHQKYRERLFCSMVGMLKNKDLAEDVASAAFEVAFDRRAEFRGESSFYTWVYAIAKNLVRDSRHRRTVSLDAIEGATPRALIEPDLLLDTQARLEQGSAVHNALGQIPDVYQCVLMDHFVHQYPVKKIASRSRVPVGTVLSRIFTGKRLLRRAWKAVT